MVETFGAMEWFEILFEDLLFFLLSFTVYKESELYTAPCFSGWLLEQNLDPSWCCSIPRPTLSLETVKSGVSKASQHLLSHKSLGKPNNWVLRIFQTTFFLIIFKAQDLNCTAPT